MSMLVEVDRACPETLPQPLRSPWYHFLSQSYNYFRYTSTISGGRKCRAKSTHTRVKTLPPNISIATDIASISVFVAKLLLLPGCGTVSTSGLYLMVFHIVWRCRRKCKGIGRARKLCRSRWNHVKMSSHRLVITTSGFGGFLLPVCISDVKNFDVCCCLCLFQTFSRRVSDLFKCNTITSLRW